MRILTTSILIYANTMLGLPVVQLTNLQCREQNWTWMDLFYLFIFALARRWSTGGMLFLPFNEELEILGCLRVFLSTA